MVFPNSLALARIFAASDFVTTNRKISPRLWFGATSGLPIRFCITPSISWIIQLSWSHVIIHLGEFKRAMLATKDPEFDVVDVTYEFENGEAIICVAFDPYGKISGLWPLPSDSQPQDTPAI
jgi:hypothetical protein